MSTIISEYPFDFIAHNYCFPPEDPFVLNLASQDDQIRTRSIEYVCDAVEFCQHHGIDQYSFHAGFRTDPDLSLTFSQTDVPAYVDSLETFCESLEKILDRVGGLDVNLAVENNVVEPQNIVNDEPLVLLCEPSEIVQLYDRLSVGGDRLGILLDTGHLRVSAATLGFDPDDFVFEAKDSVSSVHLHTNDGSEDEHCPVEPGDRELRSVGEVAEPTVTIESRFERTTALREHQLWLRSALDTL
jgi:sugar phosphate isomerase/epimerase